MLSSSGYAVLVGIYGLLFVAEGLLLWLRRIGSAVVTVELRQRILTWWVIVIACTVALTLNHWVAVAFFALVSLLALREYLSLLPEWPHECTLVTGVYIAVPVQYYWVASGWYGMFIVFIPVYMFLLLPVLLILQGRTSGYLRTVATVQWGLWMTVFSLSHLAFLLMLPELGESTVSGADLVLFLLLLTQVNDVAQYCWGKLYGRRKVVPTVSPNKTWEGLLGGVLTTVLLSAMLAPWLTPLNIGAALLVGVLLGIAGFFGDLSISALKRDLGIKDSGTLLPGHGGILDRVDSLTFTAPLFFHLLRYFYF